MCQVSIKPLRPPKIETNLQDTFTPLRNISLFLLQTGARVCDGISSPPTLSCSIITIDCKVSLKKLGQSNLVHCPQKLELPPALPLPTLDRSFCRVPERTTTLIRQTGPAGTDFTRAKRS